MLSHGSGKFLSPPLPPLALCNALQFASVSRDNWILLTHIWKLQDSMVNEEPDDGFVMVPIIYNHGTITEDVVFYLPSDSRSLLSGSRFDDDEETRY